MKRFRRDSWKRLASTADKHMSAAPVQERPANTYALARLNGVMNTKIATPTAIISTARHRFHPNQNELGKSNGLCMCSINHR